MSGGSNYCKVWTCYELSPPSKYVQQLKNRIFTACKLCELLLRSSGGGNQLRPSGVRVQGWRTNEGLAFQGHNAGTYRADVIDAALARIAFAPGANTEAGPLPLHPK